MPYVITEPCIDVKHKTCVEVCPVSCIALESDALDRMLYINPDECIDCGACEPECPENAMFQSDAVPPEWREYVELNRRWFEDRPAVRARIDALKPRVAAGAVVLDAEDSPMSSIPTAQARPGSPPGKRARGRLKILVYGAGPIGSLYAARLSAAGEDVTLLARGQRLATLRAQGIVLEEAFTGRRQTVRVPLAETLAPDDACDLVIVPMRKTSVAAVLPVLAGNTKTPTILFMVNTASGPDEWAAALGRERVLLGFPGAGGTIRDGVLRYGITPGLVQATTLGELDGRVTPRLRAIVAALRGAGFPVAVSPRMDAWLKTHVALVGPVAWALYAAAGDNHRLARTPEALGLLVRAVREGFAVLHALQIPVTPGRLRVLAWVPQPVLVLLLAWGLRGRGADVFVASHANAIRDEMAQLAVEFAALARAAGVPTPAMDCLARYCNPQVEPLPSGSSHVGRGPREPGRASEHSLA